jgi:hypothetical protein
MNLTPIVDQYLRHTAILTLELKLDEAKGAVAHRWKADEPGFRDAGTDGKSSGKSCQRRRYAGPWPCRSRKTFDVATDLYFT